MTSTILFLIDGDADLAKMLWTVIPVALLGFGLAGALLMYFVRGLEDEDLRPKEGRRNSLMRFALLAGTIFAICVFFVWMSYQS